MILAGIDPGLSGAVAVSMGRALFVHDMPVMVFQRSGKNKREVDIGALESLLRDAAPDHVFVEQIWGRPHAEGPGFATAPLLIGYGIILGIVGALHIPITRVPPQRWKRALGVPAGKDGARARATELMPQHAELWRRKKDDGRAEAALIVMYGNRTLSMSSAA